MMGPKRGVGGAFLHARFVAQLCVILLAIFPIPMESAHSKLPVYHHKHNAASALNVKQVDFFFCFCSCLCVFVLLC